MLWRQYWTKDYQHEYLFTFKGKKYFVHSIVYLTENGKKYLETTKDKVILTEHFINRNNTECWTYEIGWASGANIPLRVSTDCHPDKLIDKVVVSAHADYVERTILGAQANSYTNGIKHTKKDWEIANVRNAWLILIVSFIAAAFFKDLCIKLLIRIIAVCLFAVYRQAYISAYTTYTHEEDNEILKNKYEILYGIKMNKGDNHE